MSPRLLPPLALGAVGVLAVAVAPAGAAQSNGVAGQSASQIVSTAIAATKSATSFTVTGTIVQAGKTEGIHLTVSKTGTGQGSIVENGQTIKIIKTGGQIYFSAGKAFWTQSGGAAAARLFANRWVQGPVTDPSFSSISSFLDPTQLTSQIAPNDKSVTYKKGGTSKVAGQPVIKVTGSKKNDKKHGSMYVATTGTPFVVRLAVVSGSKNAGQLTFTNYNKAVNPAAPPNPIDISKLGTSGSSGGAAG